MGVYGYTLSVGQVNNNDFNFFSFNYDTGVHTMYSGVDWIYTHVETLYMYDYKIVYFWLLNNVYDESIDFFFFIYLIPFSSNFRFTIVLVCDFR